MIFINFFENKAKEPANFKKWYIYKGDKIFLVILKSVTLITR